MRRALLMTLTVGLVGLSAGCGLLGSGAEPSPGASAPATSSGGSQPPDEVVSVDRVSRESEVHLDIHPLEVADGLGVLRYDVSAMPTGPARSVMFYEVAMSLGGLGQTVTDGSGVRLFDTEAGTAHPVATAPDGEPAATLDETDGSGDGATKPLTGSAVAVFAAPENETVDVLFPGYGAVTVPVVDAGAGFDEAVEHAGGVRDAETKDLRAFTHAYDEESATSATGDGVTVTLASDVLFASDEHTLSKQARGVVDRAASSIRSQADGGEVRVVGHTDDVDTDAYNQKLSERRAASVADRLSTLLGGGYTLTEDGRGESEPVADGTSDEARAANRRVEIQFEGHLVVEDEAARDLPETDAPTAKNGPVSITTNGGEYAVEPTSMVRRPGAIVGTLTAERTAGAESLDVAWFLPSYLNQIGDRNFGVVADLGGAHNLSLLGARERILPFDYVGEKEPGGYVLRRLLGDEEVAPLEKGESTRITVVWPDTGQDTVTIDAPDRFRITDVPVTDAPTGD